MFSTIADGSYQIFTCHETLVKIKSEKENKRNTSANQIDMQVLTTRVQIVLFLFVQSVPITFAPS